MAKLIIPGVDSAFIQIDSEDHQIITRGILDSEIVIDSEKLVEGNGILITETNGTATISVDTDKIADTDWVKDTGVHNSRYFKVDDGNSFATVGGQDAVAVGPNTTASASSATAIGSGSSATDDEAVAIGTGAMATGYKSVAIGDEVLASDSDALAMGDNAIANASNATAIGSNTRATGDESVSMGDGTTASGSKSVAIGDGVTASGIESIAIGSIKGSDVGEARGNNSISLGSGAEAYSNDTIAIGEDAKAGNGDTTDLTDGEKAIAIGDGAVASGTNSIALGAGASTSTDNKMEIAGINDIQINDFHGDTDQYIVVDSAGTWELRNLVTGNDINIDWLASENKTAATATADNSLALGGGSSAQDSEATAVGTLANASGVRSIALGYGANVINTTHDRSIVIGHGNSTADSELSIFGVNTIRTPSFTGGSNQFIQVDSNGSWTVAEVSDSGGYLGKIGYGLDTDGGILKVDTDNEIASRAWVTSQIPDQIQYDAGYGLDLTDFIFNVDTEVIASRAYVDSQVQIPGNGRLLLGDGLEYSAVQGFNANNTFDNTLSVDTDVIATRQWVQDNDNVSNDINTVLLTGNADSVVFDYLHNGTNLDTTTLNMGVGLEGNQAVDNNHTVTIDVDTDTIATRNWADGRFPYALEITHNGNDNVSIIYELDGNTELESIVTAGYALTHSTSNADGLTLGVDTDIIAKRSDLIAETEYLDVNSTLDPAEARGDDSITIGKAAYDFEEDTAITFRVGSSSAFLGSTIYNISLVTVDGSAASASNSYNILAGTYTLQVNGNDTDVTFVGGANNLNASSGISVTVSGTPFSNGDNIVFSAPNESYDNAIVFRGRATADSELSFHGIDRIYTPSFTGHRYEHLYVDDEGVWTSTADSKPQDHSFHNYFPDSDYVERRATTGISGNNVFASDGADLRWFVSNQSAFDTDVGIGETIRVTYRNRSVDPFRPDDVGYYDVTDFTFNDLDEIYTVELAHVRGDNPLSDNANAADTDGQYFIYIADENIASVPFDGHHSGYVVAPAGSQRNNTHFLTGTGAFAEVNTQIDTDDFIAGTGITITQNGDRVEITSTSAASNALFAANGDTEASANGTGAIAIGDGASALSNNSISIGAQVNTGEPEVAVEFQFNSIDVPDGVNPVTATYSGLTIGGQPASGDNSFTYDVNDTVILVQGDNTYEITIASEWVIDSETGSLSAYDVDQALTNTDTKIIRESAAFYNNSIGLNASPDRANQLRIGGIDQVVMPDFGPDVGKEYMQVDSDGEWTTTTLDGIDLIVVFDANVSYQNNQYVTFGNQIFRANKFVRNATPWVAGTSYTTGDWVLFEDNYYIATFPISGDNRNTEPDELGLWRQDNDLINPGGENSDWDELSQAFGGTDLLMVDTRGDSAAAHAVDGIALGSGAVAGSSTSITFTGVDTVFASFGFVTLQGLQVNGQPASASNSITVPTGTSMTITQGLNVFDATLTNSFPVNASDVSFSTSLGSAANFVDTEGSTEYGTGVNCVAVGTEAVAVPDHSIAIGVKAETDTDGQLTIGADSDNLGIAHIRSPRFRPSTTNPDTNVVMIDTDGNWSLGNAGSAHAQSVVYEDSDGNTNVVTRLKELVDGRIQLSNNDSEFAGTGVTKFNEVSLADTLSEFVAVITGGGAAQALPLDTDGTVYTVVTDAYTVQISGSPSNTGYSPQADETFFEWDNYTVIAGNAEDSRDKTVGQNTLITFHSGVVENTIADVSWIQDNTLKSAVVANNTLTITKGDGDTIDFVGGGGGQQYYAGLGLNLADSEFSVNNGTGLVYRGSDSDLTVDDNLFATHTYVQSAIHQATFPTEFDTDRTDADTLYTTVVEDDRLRILNQASVTGNRTFFFNNRGTTVYQGVALRETDLLVHQTRPDADPSTPVANSSENWSAHSYNVYRSNGNSGTPLYTSHAFRYDGHTSTNFFYSGANDLSVAIFRNGHNSGSRYQFTCRLQLWITDSLDKMRFKDPGTLVSNSNEFEIDLEAGDSSLDGVNMPAVDSESGHVIHPGQYVAMRWAVHIDHFDDTGISEGNSPYIVLANTTSSQTTNAGDCDPTTLSHSLYLTGDGEVFYKNYNTNPDQEYRVLDTDGQIPHLKVNAGFKAEATGSEAIALGGSSEANNSRSIALGFEAATTADNQLVIGSTSSGNGITSIVTPQFKSSTQANFVEIDTDGNWSTNRAFASGPIATDDSDASTTADRAFAFGAGASVTGKESGALGYNASVTGDNSFAIGSTCVAGYRAIAIGQAAADSDFCTAIGWRSGRYGDGDNRLGRRTTCIGAFARAVGDNATAMGVAAQADGDNSYALGRFANSDGSHSVAIGRASEAEGDYSIAIGAGTDGDTDASPQAHGDDSIALGRNTQASSSRSVAIGRQATATQANSVAIGTGSTTTDANQVSFAGGSLTNVKLPSWTTTTRPTLSATSIGSIGFNSTTGRVELWTGSLWLQLDTSNAPT